MPLLLSLVLGAALLLASVLLLLELRHRLRPASPLRLDPGSWRVQRGGDQELVVEGVITLHNPHRRMEVFVPELEVRPVLLGRGSLEGVQVSQRIETLHADEPARPDGYWPAYIIKSHRSTQARIRISLRGTPGLDLRRLVDTLWVSIDWIHYGPFGRLLRRDGVLVPLRRPSTLTAASAVWRRGDHGAVLPIRTHLLGVLDDPLEMLRHYAGPLLQPGDILTIGETPLAVMQGRYQHPITITPSSLARLLCRVFHPTSSLATACGLQSLIDEVGPARVLIAWLVGTALKTIGFNGWFYRLAGEQARLIDDITGTTPPYDQTIVMGPVNAAAICTALAADLGVAVAVVDVNDLGRVKVLASSPGCDHGVLHEALRPNPAGNANERTPLVLVRPERRR
ncbi:MAG: F420-0:Gamma-glutamyl ligase [Cyanobacteriota bacterium]